MADKLVLNADLNYKTAEFTPEKCTVEKVIEVSETEFRKFYEKPMKPNYYLSPYKKLMGFYDESYHCVLIVNEKNGDGLLINSEGADYARYSQYIPNARALVQAHEQSLALNDLKTHMDCCVDRWLEQYKNEKDICVSLTDFINDSDLAEILADYVSESLSKHPQIENCIIANGFVEASKYELAETKLYCPLTFRVEPDDPCDDLDEVDSANYIGYDHEINAAVRADLYSDENAVKRGLAAYFYNEQVAEKVYSIFPEVETRNGELYGVAVVKSYGELDRAEMIELEEYITGQYADGFGESLEQREIKLGEDEVYISFWDCDDDYFLKPESEVFPEQEINQGMGGLS